MFTFTCTPRGQLWEVVVVVGEQHCPGNVGGQLAGGTSCALTTAITTTRKIAAAKSPRLYVDTLRAEDTRFVISPRLHQNQLLGFRLA